MPGPKREPSNLKILKGNPGKRPLNKNEPKVSGRAPNMPSWLSPAAKAIWKDLVPLLSGMQVLTAADKQALEMLCNTYAEWREANRVIEFLGITYKTTTQTGDVMYRARPEVAMRSDAARRLQSLLGEFGLTPSSRSKIKVGEESAVDPMESILNGTG